MTCCCISCRIFCDPEGFDQTAEGRIRPGFFRGVATIVCKLFNLVQPSAAYFGQKDAVQCVVIHRLITDMNYSIRLVIGDTCREADGLAMSTRNQYLNEQERQAACVVYAGLSAAKEHYQASSKAQLDAEELIAVVRHIYHQEPMVKEIQYISIASKETMEDISIIETIRSSGSRDAARNHETRKGSGNRPPDVSPDGLRMLVVR